MSNPSSPFNRALVLENLGGDEALLKQIAGMFVADWPQSLAKLRSALAASNVDALRVAAHSVKGSVANFGADAAVQAAKQLEMDCRAGDLSRAPALVEATVCAVDEVVEALRAELAA